MVGGHAMRMEEEHMARRVVGAEIPEKIRRRPNQRWKDCGLGNSLSDQRVFCNLGLLQTELNLACL